jgi:hypothetical protein
VKLQFGHEEEWRFSIKTPSPYIRLKIWVAVKSNGEFSLASRKRLPTCPQPAPEELAGPFMLISSATSWCKGDSDEGIGKGNDDTNLTEAEKAGAIAGLKTLNLVSAHFWKQVSNIEREFENRIIPGYRQAEAKRRREQATKGGRAAKADPLTKAISVVVARNPHISEADCRIELSSVEDIDFSEAGRTYWRSISLLAARPMKIWQMAAAGRIPISHRGWRLVEIE